MTQRIWHECTIYLLDSAGCEGLCMMSEGSGFGGVLITLAPCDLSTEHLGPAGLLTVEVVCRSCGRKTFTVCDIHLEQLLQNVGVDNAEGVVLCSILVPAHEVIAVMSVSPIQP